MQYEIMYAVKIMFYMHIQCTLKTHRVLTFYKTQRTLYGGAYGILLLLLLPLFFFTQGPRSFYRHCRRYTHKAVSTQNHTQHTLDDFS